MGYGETASGSIAFDRAAAYYDRTRGLPPKVMRRVVATLAPELQRRGRGLEIGTGSGRVSLPVHRAGYPIVGVDLSLPMLRRLVSNAGGAQPFPLAQADATGLPFRDDAFGAGLACHVLHLIPRWRDALAELARVVRPGGVLLIDPGGWGVGWWRRVQEEFCLAADIPLRHSGANEAAEVDAAMAALGARMRMLAAIQVVSAVKPGERIRQLEDGLYSFTWRLTEEARRRAAEWTRDFVKREIGPLDEPRSTEWTVAWRAYDLPG